MEIAYMYNVECNTFVEEVSAHDYVQMQLVRHMWFMVLQESVFITVKTFVINKYLERNLLIGYEHSK
jgi:p-aminobenzoyl-glutamate transporter AbgT